MVRFSAIEIQGRAPLAAAWKVRLNHSLGLTQRLERDDRRIGCEDDLIQPAGVLSGADAGVFGINPPQRVMPDAMANDSGCQSTSPECVPARARGIHVKVQKIVTFLG